ncbi:hypothetical protein R3P38DRAFT_2805962 [Favolaschia claudopus]|uniref:Uncharacterized protein n=1 Tax=Favolaschia claudopus TaxID=2862362 RepID=A0AAV9ZL34_9AGAR
MTPRHCDCFSAASPLTAVPAASARLDARAAAETARFQPSSRRIESIWALTSRRPTDSIRFSSFHPVCVANCDDFNPEFNLQVFRRLCTVCIHFLLARDAHFDCVRQLPLRKVSRPRSFSSKYYRVVVLNVELISNWTWDKARIANPLSSHAFVSPDTEILPTETLAPAFSSLGRNHVSPHQALCLYFEINPEIVPISSEHYLSLRISCPSPLILRPHQHCHHSSALQHLPPRLLVSTFLHELAVFASIDEDRSTLHTTRRLVPSPLLSAAAVARFRDADADAGTWDHRAFSRAPPPPSTPKPATHNNPTAPTAAILITWNRHRYVGARSANQRETCGKSKGKVIINEKKIGAGAGAGALRREGLSWWRVESKVLKQRYWLACATSAGGALFQQTSKRSLNQEAIFLGTEMALLPVEINEKREEESTKACGEWWNMKAELKVSQAAVERRARRVSTTFALSGTSLELSGVTCEKRAAELINARSVTPRHSFAPATMHLDALAPRLVPPPDPYSLHYTIKYLFILCHLLLLLGPAVYGLRQ